MGRRHILLVVLFSGAALLRFADVFRPIDQASWRESDLGAVSRNFATEGMNILYPRIDWRGDGPGYAEMEFPLYPWLTAASYKVFGIHDQIGRFWSFLFSLGAMLFFFLLAREYLSVFASTIAFAFFALNPLMVEIGTSIQPEGLMIFTYIAAVYFFIRWLKNEDVRSYWLAIFATAFTLLAKAPSAHIGLFFGILLIDKYGSRVFREARVWLFGFLSVAPSALWYVHAKNLWIKYGNSLGVSNEYHWIGWDFFTDVGFIKGIARSEFVYVWLVFGALVGAFAIWRGYKETAARHSLVWLACIFALYILAARTTSEDWASYYHVFSIPPVALIFGLAIKKLWDYMRDFADGFSSRTPAANYAQVLVCVIVIASVLASMMLEAKEARSGFLRRHTPDPSLHFAMDTRSLLAEPGPIVVSGSHCVDKNGHPIAYNASFMFYWLGRTGWNTCVEMQSVAKVDEFASRGAVYFVGQRSYMSATPGFEQELRRRYSLLDESADFAVFRLTEADR